jgi:uncharacterized protein
MIMELRASEIDRVLYSECFGRLGCHSRDRVYVVPMTYVFDGSSIISHTGSGLKVRMMRENPRVCFEVDHVNADGGWQSVIVHGAFDELHGDEARFALERLLDHFDLVEQRQGVMPPHGAGRVTPWCEQGSTRADVIFRITVEEKTGRSEVLPVRVRA